MSKRFWRIKIGQRFFVGLDLLTKTGLLGASDRLGNLYLVKPWARFTVEVKP